MSDDPKLIQLRPIFRGQIEEILDALTRSGFQPKISNAFRTAAQQAEKVKLGYANPKALNPGAHNWGLACDIIDRRWGWSLKYIESASLFFASLGDLAMAKNLVWGGSWFGAGGTRAKPTHRSPWNKYGIGWDPAHVEFRKIPQEWMIAYGPDQWDTATEDQRF